MRKICAVLMMFVLSACAPVRPLVAQTDQPSAGPVIMKLSFEGRIDSDSVNAAIRLMNQAKAAGADLLVIEINSGGGEVDAGFRWSRAIETYKLPIICVVEGEADSMAAYVLMSCPSRLMTKRSNIMIHAPSLSGDFYGQAKDFRDLSRQLEVATLAMAEHFAKHMGQPMALIMAHMNDGDWWMEWTEALTVRAVDGIVDSPEAVVDALRNGQTPSIQTLP